MSPATTEGAVRLNEEITRQAAMVAYVDDFRLMTVLAFVGAGLMLLLWLAPLRPPARQPAGPIRAS
jgi:DHA2 family multidrug resistance protein